MATITPKDVLDSFAYIKEPKGCTVPAITKFLRQNYFFARASVSTKLAIHQALSKLCEQGLLTCNNRRYQVNTLARTVVRRRRSRRRASRVASPSRRRRSRSASSAAGSRRSRRSSRRRRRSRTGRKCAAGLPTIRGGDYPHTEEMK